MMACPRCGKTEVRYQTPVENGMVNEAFFRCFACDLKSDPWPGWTPIAYPHHGSRPIDQLRDFWYEWAAKWKLQPAWAKNLTWEPIPQLIGQEDDPGRITHVANLELNGRSLAAFQLADGSYEVEDVEAEELREQLEGFNCSAGFCGGLGR